MSRSIDFLRDLSDLRHMCNKKQGHRSGPLNTCICPLKVRMCTKEELFLILKACYFGSLSDQPIRTGVKLWGGLTNFHWGGQWSQSNLIWSHCWGGTYIRTGADTGFRYDVNPGLFYTFQSNLQICMSFDLTISGWRSGVPKGHRSPGAHNHRFTVVL